MLPFIGNLSIQFISNIIPKINKREENERVNKIFPPYSIIFSTHTAHTQIMVLRVKIEFSSTKE